MPESSNPPRQRPLVLNFPPRGLPRARAAAYLGISVSYFDQLRDDRVIPSPKRIGGKMVWDIRDLDALFDSLPYENHDVDDGWTFAA